MASAVNFLGFYNFDKRSGKDCGYKALWGEVKESKYVKKVRVYEFSALNKITLRRVNELALGLERKLNQGHLMEDELPNSLLD